MNLTRRMIRRFSVACLIGMMSLGALSACQTTKPAGNTTPVKYTEGSCCAKAAADGKVCAHPCCVEAAKAGGICKTCNK